MSALTIVAATHAAGYRTFASALRTTDHIAELEGPGPFTVFAPTDAAFEKFSSSQLDRLLQGDPALLRLVLGFHIAAGAVRAARFAGCRIRATMRTGGHVIINGRAAVLRVNGAQIVEPDIAAANGVIHGVNAVLWPREADVRAA
jgi:uncharacterized surface protein with fasciclin (FAS1) repeats